MNAVVHDIFPVEPAFVPQKSLKLFIYVSDNFGKAVGIVNGIPVSWGVHHR